MKNIVISGGITRDAVTRTTQSGDKVTGFSVAVSEGFGDAKRTLYFDCTLWGKRGEALEQYLTKGSKVSVAGDLSTREHEGKTYLTVRADQVTLLGGKPSGERDDDRGGASKPPSAGARGVDDDQDAIPFNRQVL